MVHVHCFLREGICKGARHLQFRDEVATAVIMGVLMRHYGLIIGGWCILRRGLYWLGVLCNASVTVWRDGDLVNFLSGCKFLVCRSVYKVYEMAGIMFNFLLFEISQLKVNARSFSLSILLQYNVCSLPNKSCDFQLFKVQRVHFERHTYTIKQCTLLDKLCE